MSKEGSLGAPIRHPIDFEHPDFLNPEKLDAEMRRVFDICHGCRRCFNLCDSFPKLFDMIDESKNEDVESLSSDQFAPVVDACTLCDMCFMTKCPYVPPHDFDLDFPHLMLRYRTAQKKLGKLPSVPTQLAQIDRNAKIGIMFSKIVNWASNIKNKLIRKILELITGIEIAVKYDERIIIEKNIVGRELECGVLGKSIMKSSVVGEVKFQTDWYTYESKYNANLSSTIIPADLNIEISNKIQKLAIEACKAINAYGLARVDFFYQESTQQIYINEVNTLPGFTKTSMYPMLWEASGLKLEKLVASLIETAKE